MNLPNLLTIVRFILVPFMTYFLICENFTLAILLYVIASITDVVDGFIARKFNLVTQLGKFLDPLADKLLQFSALVGLWVVNLIPLWIVIIFFLKEIFMGIGAIKLLQKNIVVQSKWFGKLSTIFFFLAIIASMLTPFIKTLSTYILPLFILALLSLLFAFIMYLLNFIKEEQKEVVKG